MLGKSNIVVAVEWKCANITACKLVEMPVICHTQWNPEVEYSSIFIFVSVTWGYTDIEST